MSNSRHWVVASAVLVVLALNWNQWRLKRDLKALAARLEATTSAAHDKEVSRLKTEARFDEVNSQLQSVEQQLANAHSRTAGLEDRIRQMERAATQRPTRPPRPEELTQRTQSDPRTENRARRAWGPEQAEGAPDTFEAGDISTAWASREQDGGEEWLQLDYENPVDIAEVRVRETHNPGAVSKITAVLAGGAEIVLWEGVEPPATPPVEMSFQIATPVRAGAVKVYLDTKRVPGWNEIDAVELIGRDGSRQWARHVTASSTYAEPRATGDQSIGTF